MINIISPRLLASTVKAAENANFCLKGLPRLESDDPTVASEEKLSQASVGGGEKLAQVRDRMVRVEAGFLGMLIEKPGLIAPGDWEIVI